MPGTALLSETFEFAAAHRLHCPDLTEAENRRIFGKCNNPNGHGHNYRVEVAVRVPLDNADGGLIVGSRVTAVIDAGEVEGDFVPATAVVRTGTGAVVFVEREGVYTARSVRTGERVGALVRIIEGLTPGEAVAENGQLLIDSESFIRPNDP